MKIGYARVSTRDQKLTLQVAALKREGCDQIYKEKMSGKLERRPALDKALSLLNEGDELIVWKVDRLSRTVIQLVSLRHGLQQRGVHIRSISEGIDTSTKRGRLMYNVVASFAEFECDQISDRTVGGLGVAKAQGARLGRPCKLSGEKLRVAEQLRRENVSFAEIARRVGESRTTVWRALSEEA